MNNDTLKDQKFIRRCIQLGEMGTRASMPNPCVGAVIVYQDEIIGEGYTSQYGGSHGEVNAIHSVKKVKHLKEATLYVSLEPCSHYGKTPPCANLIVEKQIKRVVIGTLDPNPKVAGKGVQILKDAGIEITVGVLEDEVKWSLRYFLKSITKKRPYVTLKWAESRDGFIARENGRAVKITNSTTQILTHRMRSEHQGILCGWKTVVNDQPKLDNRLWTGPTPKVIVIDLHQKLNNDSHFQQQAKWWRIVHTASERENDILVEKDNLDEILNILYEKDIHSLFVEGGAFTHQQFIDTQLWDECYKYIGNVEINKGISAPKLTNNQLFERFEIKEDLVMRYVSL
ncbi:MAG: bifunctional diaminohydroxyphosphoribosylaminopyrimidine deaminase/5-amino-6-(5-phosphoribosylamino)uracil reductase RibD [Chitinophagales bacterium]|nr:bifunctional diaminohydroxyphosphoribosylaminopyrimidine deaminase/5-amino-6-(5-phosphoribosylamino)uracil reductase RibD [Chitinophagales bacterium]